MLAVPRFSKAWKTMPDFFQALEKLSPNFSNAWKYHRSPFPMLGKVTRGLCCE
jgi:hypothetical protein